MLPGRRAPSAPESAPVPEPPQSTSSKAGGSLTMVISTSDDAATSRGDLASLAPAATNASARETVRFHTVNLYPAFNRLSPMGPPIKPSPIKPTLEPGPIFLVALTLAPGPIFTPGPIVVLRLSSVVTNGLLNRRPCQMAARSIFQPLRACRL